MFSAIPNSPVDSASLKDSNALTPGSSVPNRRPIKYGLSCSFTKSQITNKIISDVAVNPVDLFTIFIASEETLSYQVMNIMIPDVSFIRE